MAFYRYKFRLDIFLWHRMVMTQALNGAGDAKTRTIQFVFSGCFRFHLHIFFARNENGINGSSNIHTDCRNNDCPVMVQKYFKKGKWKEVNVLHFSEFFNYYFSNTILYNSYETNLLILFLAIAPIFQSYAQGKKEYAAYNIAVKTDSKIHYEIFTMNLDGSESQNITNNPDVAWIYRAYKTAYFLSATVIRVTVVIFSTKRMQAGITLKKFRRYNQKIAGWISEIMPKK